MWLRHPLDDVLSSRVKVAVLRVLALASVPLSGREISRRANTDPGYTSRVLRELAASGLAARRDQGRVNTYELTGEGNELLTRLKELFAAEHKRYSQAVRNLSEEIPDTISIILFGSEARGKAKPGSDTDILIVVELRTEDLEDRISETCLALTGQHLLALSWHVADLDDLREWEENDSPFWREILRDGIKLSGSSIGSLRRRWQAGGTS